MCLKLRRKKHTVQMMFTRAAIPPLTNSLGSGTTIEIGIISVFLRCVTSTSFFITPNDELDEVVEIKEKNR